MKRSSLDEFLAADDDDDDDDDIDAAMDQAPKLPSYNRNKRPESASTRPESSDTVGSIARGMVPDSAPQWSKGSSLDNRLSPRLGGKPGREGGRSVSRDRDDFRDHAADPRLRPPSAGAKGGRSPSPSSASTSRNQAMTSIGPGLGGLSGRGASPAPLQPENTGPGLGAVGRAASPAPLGGRGPPADDNDLAAQLRNVFGGVSKAPTSGRSPSPSPLGNQQSMTSTGPGLGSLGKSGRSPSPSPLGNQQSGKTLSTGPALGGIGKSGRSPSPSPLEESHSMTSIGRGVPMRPSRPQSPAPLEGGRSSSRAPHEDQAGSLEAGPSGLASLRRQVAGDSQPPPSQRSPAALQPSPLQSSRHRGPSPARLGGASLEAGPGGLGSVRRDVHTAATIPIPSRSEFARAESCDPPSPLGRSPSPAPLARKDLGSLGDGKEKKTKKDKKQKKEKRQNQTRGEPDDEIEEIEPSFSSSYPQFGAQRGRTPNDVPLGDIRQPSPSPLRQASPAPLTAVRPPSPGPLRQVREPSPGPLRASSPSPGPLKEIRAPSPSPSRDVRRAPSGEPPLEPQGLSKSKHKDKKSKRDKSASREVADENTTAGSKSLTEEKTDKKVKRAKKDKTNKIESLSHQGSLESIGFVNELDGGKSVVVPNRMEMVMNEFGDLDDDDDDGSIGDLDGGRSVMQPRHDDVGNLDGGGSVTLASNNAQIATKKHQGNTRQIAAAEYQGFSPAVGSSNNGRESKGQNVQASSKSDEKAKVTISGRPASAPVTGPSGRRNEKSLDSQVLRRFFISFDPPMLAAEVGVGTQNIIRQVPAKSALEGGGEARVSMRSRAERLLKDLMLPSRHAEQVEALLGRLAARALPVYRVVCPGGADLVDAEAPELGLGAPRTLVPSGALVLARERRKSPDGWWIRLAAGGGWMQQTAATGEEVAVRCDPQVEEIRQWLDRAAAETARGGITAKSSFLVRNAAAVSSQVGLGPGRPSAKRLSHRGGTVDSLE